MQWGGGIKKVNNSFTIRPGDPGEPGGPVGPWEPVEPSLPFGNAAFIVSHDHFQNTNTMNFFFSVLTFSPLSPEMPSLPGLPAGPGGPFNYTKY